MKTKEEILKMNLKQLEEEKMRLRREEYSLDCRGCRDCWDCWDCWGCWGCRDCWDCWDCWDCRGCLDCRDCWGCLDCRGLRYAICNVVLTKEEYEKKIKELIKEEK